MLKKLLILTMSLTLLSLSVLFSGCELVLESKATANTLPAPVTNPNTQKAPETKPAPTQSTDSKSTNTSPATSNPEPTQQKKSVIRIEISKKDKTLKLFIDDKLQKQYKVAVGKPSTPTPSGTYKVINKAVNPDWLDPKTKILVKGSDPNNPLGERWMGLSRIEKDGSLIKTGLGIHGTTAPSSIGTEASHGCIRMHNKEVEELFPNVPVGTIVTIK